MPPAPPEETTLESIVREYRHQEAQAAQQAALFQRAAAQTAAPPGRAPPATEFEIRLEGVTAGFFAEVYRALLRESAAAAPAAPWRLPEPRPAPALTEQVSVLDMSGEDAAGARRRLRATKIFEKRFRDGKGDEGRYTIKTPLVLPYRATSASGIPYKVALSTEAPATPFTRDETSLIRVKARVSFEYAVAGVASTPAEPAVLRWRIDLTVARQIAGSQADALPGIIAQMFRGQPPLAAENLCEVLRLDDEEYADALWSFEVEAELAAEPAQRDRLRPGDVQAAVATLMWLANPGYAREAAHAAEVARLVQIVAPERAREFAARRLGLKQLLPQAVALTRDDYRAVYPPAGFYVTDKANGERAIAIVRGGRGRILTANEIWRDPVEEAAAAAQEAPGAPQPPAAGVPAVAAAGALTVLDGEYIPAEEGSGRAAHYYAFDVLVHEGMDLQAQGLEERVKALPVATAALAATGLAAAPKTYAVVAGTAPAEIERVVRAVIEAPHPYPVDAGLILVRPGQPYAETQTYKWKALEDNTIDFYARKAPAAALGRPPYLAAPGHALYFLFVGIRADLYRQLGLQRCPGYEELFGRSAAGGPEYFPLQFSPPDTPFAFLYQHPAGGPDIDKKVVEMRVATQRKPAAAAAAKPRPAKKKVGGGDADAPLAATAPPRTVDWELVRVRTDRQRDLRTQRYFGNDWTVAEKTWLNVFDEFTLDQLWAGPGAVYFRGTKDTAYAAQTALVRAATTRRIEALLDAGWVVDLAAGRGQDLGRYLAAGVHHLVAVDNDRAALSELVGRRYTHARKLREREAGRGRGAGRGAGGRRATTVHVLAADVNAPWADTRAAVGALGLPAEGADAVVCNLAVHYFLGTVEALRNFVELARALLRPGGTLALLAFAGEAVHALLQRRGIAAGQTWESRDGDGLALKYAIRREYAAETLTEAGQKIAVLHPFSDGALYEENLVSFGALKAEFAARGFRVAAEGSVASEAALRDFAAANPRLAAALTPADIEYAALYHELVLVAPQ